jgi:glycosyltransferase involved in cell wall biosynthesis
MKIGIDAHFIGNQQTGNETYTLNLVQNLAVVDTEANEYSLYLTNPAAAVGPLVTDSRFHNYLLKPGNPFMRIPLVIPWEMSRRPVEVLHTHYMLPPFLPKQVRTVVTIHDVSWEYYPELYSRGDLLRLKTTVPWSARRADRILAVSNTVKDAVVRLFDIEAEKIVVTPLAASQNFYPRERDSCRKRLLEKYGIQGRFILFVGNMSPRKNLIGVLRAFAQLRKRGELEAKLVVAGPRISNSTAFVDALRELQLGDDVLCIGNVAHDILPELYSAAEVFVFPSLYEAFGLPTLEAMACGTPVVAADRPAFPEIAGDAALLVNPDDTAALAAGIDRVLSNPALREELRASGLKRVLHFNWKATASQTLAVYNSLARRTANQSTHAPWQQDSTGQQEAARYEL